MKQEKIKTRLNSQNVCYHSVKNIASFCLLSKHRKIKKNTKYNQFVFLQIYCPKGIAQTEELSVQVAEDSISK